MKKVIVGIVLFAMFFVTPVLAADIDLSSMEVEELVDLKNKIDDELYEKQGFLDLNYGYYTVGKDIAAGEFTIKPYGEGSDNSSDFWQIIIYKSEELKQAREIAGKEYSLKLSEARANEEAGVEVQYPEAINEYDYISLQEYVHCPMEYTIVLEEGNVLYVGDGVLDDTVKLVISKGAKKGLFMD